MPSTLIPRSTQVLIVGGGPAGASAAWHCAKAGLDVVVVDRAHFPRPKPCAEYVSPEGLRILSAMGALGTLESHAASLTGMQVHAPSGDIIHGEFVAAHGFRGFRDRGLGIRRELLDATLLNCARDAGARVIEGVKVEQIERDTSGRVAGISASTSGGRVSIGADLTIGADGLRSVVARRLNVAHQSRWPRRVALVAHYRGVRQIGSLGEMHVTNDGYIGLADVGNGVTNVALVVPVSRARAMNGDPEAFLHAWLQRHSTLAARFANAERVSPVRATGPFASHARDVVTPGAMLVGDAADFFDPFTGEGIFAALRGGGLLAPFAADVVAARADKNKTAEHSALAAYSRARCAAFVGKWRVERLIGAAVASPALMNVAARALARDRTLADLLVGVTGDFVPPGALVKPRTLLRMCTAFARGLWPRTAPPSISSLPVHVHRT